MEKAKNYYVVLEHGKDGKWNLPLDERLSKEIKKMYRGNNVAEEHSSYLRANPPSAHVQNLNTFG
jgi:hypothetical protein